MSSEIRKCNEPTIFFFEFSIFYLSDMLNLAEPKQCYNNLCTAQLRSRKVSAHFPTIDV